MRNFLRRVDEYMGPTGDYRTFEVRFARFLTFLFGTIALMAVLVWLAMGGHF